MLAGTTDWSELAKRQIGYTELQNNLPGGRHNNVRTSRAVIIRGDGTHRKPVAEQLIDNPNAWTQFVGWSPDGRQTIVYRGWQDPENARWEEEHKTFRFDPKAWQLDSCLVDVAAGKITNVTAVERVSHYNGGLFFLPGNRQLGFTPLIQGISKPYVMDLDGRNKRDVSGKDAGFAYGYSASPDGTLISYHENYQIYVANADGTNKRHIATGNSFNFGPRWSPDGQWLLFVSGVHGNCHPYVVKRDGQGLKKLADRNGYQGWIQFLDVYDFHQGSSDVPVWSADGKTVFYTALVDQSVELFQVSLEGKTEQLTKSAAGTLHYHPEPSADGKWLLFGSKRDGVRQLFVMQLSTLKPQDLNMHCWPAKQTRIRISTGQGMLPQKTTLR
jgi:TolB protein